MDQLQYQISAEQLRAVYRQLPAVVSAVAGASLFVYILRDIHSRSVLSIWFGLVIISCLFAGFLYLYFLKHGGNNLSLPRWKILFLVFALYTGVVWGMIGITFYSAPTEYKLFIVAWLWAMGAGMATLLVAYKPAFYSMIIPLFIPLSISLAFDGNDFYRGLSAATLVWMISLMYFYQGNHKTFLGAISLRFINAKLVEDLAKKNKETENANLAKSQFLAAASHDLRQPLHAQSLFIAELDQYVDTPTGRRILGGLESSIYAMRKLLNAILDISKLDAGTVTPAIEDFSVSSVLLLLKEEFEPLATERGSKLRIKNCKFFITTDPVLLEIILRNLISNAIRYTNKGKILIGCRRRNKILSIQILDSGVGIPENKLNDIFSPFIQLGNPERDREKGLGLGLSIVQRTAALLGHTLNLKSTLNRGTKVTIQVPLSSQIPAPGYALQTSTYKENIRGKRVLIIDDDSHVRTAMFGLLKSWGCFPLIFQSVHSALKYTEEDNEAIHAILSDFNLAGDINGIQAIAKLRERYGASIPAALVTGDTSVDRLREAKNTDHLLIHKPVLASELRALINKLVAQV